MRESMAEPLLLKWGGGGCVGCPCQGKNTVLVFVVEGSVTLVLCAYETQDNTGHKQLF